MLTMSKQMSVPSYQNKLPPLAPQFTMDRANAEEFYEVYKGVVTEYPVSLNNLSKNTLWDYVM